MTNIELDPSRRLPLIVGNWKMNKTATEARLLAQTIVGELGDYQDAEVVLCPPFTALAAVADVIRYTNIALGAQNMHFEKSGAFTGEVSGVFLKDMGCMYVILGHSERRTLFGETDEIVSRKLKTALEIGLSPIVCVGESLQERETGQTMARLKAQFEQSIVSVVTKDDVITLAYEPIWAIGTGRTATPGQASEAHAYLRSLASEHFGSDWAAGLRILYGGSVTPENIDQLMAELQINGVLVGGASLKPSFTRIVKFHTA